MSGLEEGQTAAERIGFLETDGPIVTGDHTFVTEEDFYSAGLMPVLKTEHLNIK